jgi:NADH-quinone oxidoreductase subunit C
MNADSVVAAFRESFPGLELEPETFPVDETVISLPLHLIHPAVQVLIERFDLYHLSTITGDEVGTEIQLLYHFWDGQGLTLQTSLPSDAPRIPTTTDLIPGAAFYEREVSEMFGVAFDGHPDPRPLLLPDDWDDGPGLRCQELADE